MVTSQSRPRQNQPLGFFLQLVHVSTVSETTQSAHWHFPLRVCNPRADVLHSRFPVKVSCSWKNRDGQTLISLRRFSVLEDVNPKKTTMKMKTLGRTSSTWKG